jgi:membrane protein YqaA with SNARE-associated domain
MMLLGAKKWAWRKGSDYHSAYCLHIGRKGKMQQQLGAAVSDLLAFLAMPEVGLSAVFLVSFLASTLLPLGSEPVLIAYLQLQPGNVWPALAVGTLGNTLGGVVSYAMGLGLVWAVRYFGESGGRWSGVAQNYVRRFGPVALLFSWLPVIGDPLCAVAGGMRLSFWSCLFFIALGKFLRYLAVASAFLWASSGA